jgi:hypothetical protein
LKYIAVYEGHMLFIHGPQDAAGRKLPLNFYTTLIRCICGGSEHFIPSHVPTVFNPKSFFDTDKSLGLVQTFREIEKQNSAEVL